MKKTLFSLIIVSFVFGLLAVSTTRAEETGATTTDAIITAPVMVTTAAPENVATTTADVVTTTPETVTPPPAPRESIPADLEKILSPDQIKNFQMIKKIGTSLYGVRKGTTTIRIATSTTPGLSNKLEKIAAPALINLYERIQKIGTALWGIKKKATSTPMVIEPEIATCVANAIDAKDKVLMTRVTAAATELNAALAVRSTCQQAAVKATSTPRETLNACVKTFNEAQKAIKETSKTLQNETWKTYQESLKACRTAATSTSPVPVIEDGGNLFN